MANETTADKSLRPAPGVTTFRRIVTGHSGEGKAIFLEDRICPNAFCMGSDDAFVCTDLWRTEKTPADNSGEYEDPTTDFNLTPSPCGTVFRILEIPPLHQPGAKSGVLMHRTSSVDYAMVLKGEAVAILDDGAETVMGEGDVLIQRGTLHGWDNRTDRPVIILFVLCGAGELPGLPAC